MKTNLRIKGEDETLDAFYHGRILVLQKKRGYRFSIDAPLLADFIQTREKDRLLEIGTGSGIISLLLSIKPFRHIEALEIQESLADLARRNVLLNKLEGRVRIIEADVRDYFPPQRFDIVFANPPYIRERTGRLSSSSEKSIAKHELKCTLFDIMQKTGESMKTNGKAYFIYPARGMEYFKLTVRKKGLQIAAVRPVFAHKDREPRFFLTACEFRAGEEKRLAPLILFERDGSYTEEAEKIFAGRVHAAIV